MREHGTRQISFDWRKSDVPGGRRLLVLQWESWLLEGSLWAPGPWEVWNRSTHEGTGKRTSQKRRHSSLIYNSLSNQCPCYLWHCNTALGFHIPWNHPCKHEDSTKLKISVHSFFMAGRSPQLPLSVFYSMRESGGACFTKAVISSVNPSLAWNQNYLHFLYGRFFKHFGGT